MLRKTYGNADSPTNQCQTWHVAGDLNVLGEIPCRSFGYYKQWHCANNYEFISLINSQLPLIDYMGLVKRGGQH